MNDVIVEQLYARIGELESIFRQVEGTIAVFIAHKKLIFSNPQSRATFDELLKKWQEESVRPIGMSLLGRPPRRVAKSKITPTTSFAKPDVPTLTDGKNPAAVVMGRLGGKKGGLARAQKLSKERHSEIAKAGATARWQKTSA